MDRSIVPLIWNWQRATSHLQPGSLNVLSPGTFSSKSRGCEGRQEDERNRIRGANENVPGPDCVLGRSLNSPPSKSALTDIVGFRGGTEYGPDGLLGGNCVKRSPNGVSDSGIERERRRDHLRLGTPFLRQRRFERVLKEVAKASGVFRLSLGTRNSRPHGSSSVLRPSGIYCPSLIQPT